MVQFYDSPEEEARAVRRAVARAAGCDVTALRVTPGTPPRVIGAIECEDGWGAARLLVALAEEDARTSGARALAAELRAGLSPLEYARRLHAFVKERVRFEPEEGEIFQSGAYTLTTGVGDCDCHARLVYGLAVAGGLPAWMGLLHHGDRPDAPQRGPAHAVALLCPSSSLLWAETTVDARFGEAPNVAAARLGLQNERSDIAKEVCLMSASDLPPVPLDSSELDELDAGAPLVTAATAATLGDLAPAPDPVVPRLTAHLNDAFFSGLIDLAAYFNSRGARVSAADLLAVFQAESGVLSPGTAARPTGPHVVNSFGCAGLNQICPLPGGGPLSGLAAVGFRGTMADYLALSAEEQIPFVRAFFDGKNFYGKIAGMGGLYLANFAGGFLGSSDSRVMFRASSDPVNHPGPYEANRGVDAAGKGWIEVGDMGPFVAKTARGPAWDEALARLGPAGLSGGVARSILPGVVVVLGLVGALVGARWLS